MPGVGLRPARNLLAPAPRRVDPTHPLAAGLLAAQWVGGDIGEVGGSGGAFGPGPYGRVFKKAGNGDCVGVPIRRRWGAMFHWTLHTIVRVELAGFYAALFGCPHNPASGSWVAPYHAHVIARDGFTDDPIVGTNNGSGTYTFVSTPTTWLLEDGEVHSYTAAWGNRGAAWWRDGVLIATHANTAVGTGSVNPATVGTPEFVFGCRSAATPDEGFTGDAIYQAMWERRLENSEVAALHQDPLAFLVR